VAERP
jgi:hypothetical protein